MKQLTYRVFVVVALLATFAFSAFSESEYVLRVNVPFEFTVGKTVLPAGEYIVMQDTLGSIVTLQDRHSKRAVAAITTNGGTALRGGRPELVFQNVNGHKTLMQIQLANAPSRLTGAALKGSALR